MQVFQILDRLLGADQLGGQCLRGLLELARLGLVALGPGPIGQHQRLAGLGLQGLDLTELAEPPRAGDEVVLVGTQNGTTLTFHDLAAWGDTISYEVMCGISKRVPRTYFRRGKVETFKSLLGVLPNHAAV